ncbi:alcohol dehydrogenase catalytic domain-containing protein [Bacillus sp. N9]
MKAAFVDNDSKRLYIGEASKPAIKKDEILVRVKATALNRADLLQKRGLYPPPEGASPILGLEMSGVIEEIGEHVQGWKIGDRVCALLPGEDMHNILLYLHLWQFLFQIIFLLWKLLQSQKFFDSLYEFILVWLFAKGQTVLIHAGASGVGTAAIQLAREAGAKIIVTAGSHEKESFAFL